MIITFVFIIVVALCPRLYSRRYLASYLLWSACCSSGLFHLPDGKFNVAGFCSPVVRLAKQLDSEYFDAFRFSLLKHFNYLHYRKSTTVVPTVDHGHDHGRTWARPWLCPWSIVGVTAITTVDVTTVMTVVTSMVDYCHLRGQDSGHIRGSHRGHDRGRLGVVSTAK